MNLQIPISIYHEHAQTVILKEQVNTEVHWRNIILMFKFGMAGAGQIQGGSVWKKHAERKIWTPRLYLKQERIKLSFYISNPKSVLLPGGVLQYCYLLSFKGKLEKFPMQAYERSMNCSVLLYDAREIYLRPARTHQAIWQYDVKRELITALGAMELPLRWICRQE